MELERRGGRFTIVAQSRKPKNQKPKKTCFSFENSRFWCCGLRCNFWILPDYVVFYFSVFCFLGRFNVWLVLLLITKLVDPQVAVSCRCNCASFSGVR